MGITNDETMKNKLRKLKQAMIMVAVPITFGGLVYYFFYPTVSFVTWIDSFFSWHPHFSLENTNVFLSVMRWYFFDFLWSFSFASAVYLLPKNKRLSHILSLIVPILCGIVFEILQLGKIVNGTFDVVDIFVEVIAAILSIFLNYEFDMREKRQ